MTSRGVTQMAFAVRTGITVTEGRTFEAGLNEVVVGRKIFERIEGMEVGRSFELQRRDWRIVGVFDAVDSELEHNPRSSWPSSAACWVA